MTRRCFCCGLGTSCKIVAMSLACVLQYFFLSLCSRYGLTETVACGPHQRTWSSTQSHLCFEGLWRELRLRVILGAFAFFLALMPQCALKHHIYSPRTAIFLAMGLSTSSTSFWMFWPSVPQISHSQSNHQHTHGPFSLFQDCRPLPGWS